MARHYIFSASKLHRNLENRYLVPRQSLFPGEAVASIVNVLRDWRGAAERGQLCRVVLAGMKASGRTRANWVGTASADQSVAAATFIHAWIAKTSLKANQ